MQTSEKSIVTSATFSPICAEKLGIFVSCIPRVCVWLVFCEFANMGFWCYKKRVNETWGSLREWNVCFFERQKVRLPQNGANKKSLGPYEWLLCPLHPEMIVEEQWDHQQIPGHLTLTFHRRWKVLWVVAGQRRQAWISLHVNQDDDQGGSSPHGHAKPSPHTHGCPTFCCCWQFWWRKNTPYFAVRDPIVIPYFGKLSVSFWGRRWWEDSVTTRVGRFRWTFKRSLSSGHILVPFDLLNEFEIFLGGGFKDFLFLPQLSSLTNVFWPQAKQKPKAGWGLLFRVLMFCGEAILVRAWWVCKSMFLCPQNWDTPPLGGSFQLEPPYTSRLGHLEEQPSWSLTTYSLGWSSKQGRSPYSTIGKETSWTQKRDMMLVPSREWFPFSWRSHLFQVSGGKKDTNSWCLESLYSRLQVLDLSKSSDDSVWKVGSGDPFWKMSSASFWHTNQWLMTRSHFPWNQVPIRCPLTK